MRLPKPPLEAVVQKQVSTLFRSVGCTVRSLSQYRPSTVALGLPDLLVTHQRKEVAFFFEVKRPQRTGYDPWNSATWIPEDLRRDQLIFRADCLATHLGHYWGGVPEAQSALVSVGLAEMRGGQFWLRAA